jgi:O-antigen ligase
MAIYYISFWRETFFSGINNYVLLALIILISGILISEHISGYELALFFRKLLGFEIYNYGQPMDHATALYTLLLPFCFYHFRNEKKYLMTLSFSSLLVLIFHPMFAAILAVCLAIISACITLALKRKGVILLAVISISIILFIPQLMSYLLNLDYFQAISSIPASWHERLDIWMKTVELINERPMLGWGLGTSSRVEELIVPGASSIIQVHPHNIPLQIRLEAGLPGLILFCCLIGMFWRYAFKQTDRAYAGACVASLVIYLSFAMVSFNAWHSWWLSTQYLAVLSLLCFKTLPVAGDITNA